MFYYPSYYPYQGYNPLPVVELPSKTISDKVPFRVRAGLLDEFRAHASFRLPHELGGLLRVEHDAEGPIATEYKLFPQIVDPGNFELDGEAIAQWQLELMKADREDELSEWSGIIHSHPRMAPFMSWNDHDNLEATAGQREAWSLICTVGKPWVMPGRDYEIPMELCHYYNGADDELEPNMLVTEVGVAHNIDPKTLDAMQAEVKSLTKTRWSMPTMTAYSRDWFRKS